MIVTRLLGGLGNQLFQYAAARAVSLRTGMDQWLDLRAYADDPRRRFALEPFALLANEAPEHVLRQLPPLGPGVLATISRTLARAGIPSGRPRLYLEPTLSPLDGRIPALTRPAYLVGYWQSERYFEAYESQIRQDLALPPPRNPLTVALLRLISGSASASIHIRRGDYIHDPAIAAVHATCDLDYYARARRLVEGATGSSTQWFAFSDDPDWVREHLDFPRLTVVDHNSVNDAHEDMRLMSACHAHVIANSSLSWWGAWLGSREDFVVAPRAWVNDGRLDTRDVIPKRWRRT